MKTRVLICALLLCLSAVPLRAQWMVFDWNNLSQSIVNSVNEMVETSTTAENMIATFHKTEEIYNQGKKYYDRLESVTNLVKDAKKVQMTVLALGEISDMYVTNYAKMLSDGNYTQRELSAIAFGYNAIMRKGSDAILELQQIVNPTDLSMTDKERMDLVDKIYNEMMHYRNLANYFTRKTISVSYFRAKKSYDTERVMQLYGTSDIDNQ